MKYVFSYVTTEGAVRKINQDSLFIVTAKYKEDEIFFGAVCDGAKASCAAKIASSLDAAVMGSKMALAGRVYQPDEGLVLDNIDETIKSVGYVGRVGMKETDIEILHVMLGDRDLSI